MIVKCTKLCINFFNPIYLDRVFNDYGIRLLLCVNDKHPIPASQHAACTLTDCSHFGARIHVIFR